MQAGAVTEACQRFAESLDLQRRGGTLLNLAVCRETERHYGEAYRLFEEALEVARTDGHPDRVALATQHLAELKSRIGWLVLRFSPAAPADTSVHFGEEDIPANGWGTPQAVSLGNHTLRVERHGRSWVSTDLDVRAAGIQIIVEIPPPPAEPTPAPATLSPTNSGLQTQGAAAVSSPHRASPAPAPVAPPIAGPAATNSPRKEPVPLPAEASTGKPFPWARVAGATAIGLGTVGLAVGSIFGAKALRNSQESQDICANDICNDATPEGQRGYQLNQDARTAAWISNISVVSGIAVLGAGAYLLWQSRSTAGSPGTQVPPRTAGLAPRAGSGSVGAVLYGVW